MISRRKLIGSFTGGLIIGSATSSILNNNPNEGLPNEKESSSFSRKINKNTILLEYLFPPKFKESIVKSQIRIPKEKYIRETETEDMYHNQIDNAIKDDFMKNKISNNFIPNYDTENVRKILNFVQNIRYSRDWKSTDSKNYSRHPIETLVDRVGDCKDKSILLYSILKHKGYDIGYVIYPQHIAPVIARSQVEEALSDNIKSVVENNKYEYIVLESTNPKYIGKSDYNKNNIIYSYTEYNGFKLHNPKSITKQIQKMITV